MLKYCTGTEPITVEWMHEGVEVQDSSGFKYSHEGGLHSLVIADAFPEDAGPYTCKASNQYGTAQCVTTLSVQGHFQIIRNVLFVSLKKLSLNSCQTLNDAKFAVFRKATETGTTDVDGCPGISRSRSGKDG